MKGRPEFIGGLRFGQTQLAWITAGRLLARWSTLWVRSIILSSACLREVMSTSMLTAPTSRHRVPSSSPQGQLGFTSAALV